jgi:hypothetical protein
VARARHTGYAGLDGAAEGSGAPALRLQHDAMRCAEELHLVHRVHAVLHATITSVDQLLPTAPQMPGERGWRATCFGGWLSSGSFDWSWAAALPPALAVAVAAWLEQGRYRQGARYVCLTPAETLAAVGVVVDSLSKVALRPHKPDNEDTWQISALAWLLQRLDDPAHHDAILARLVPFAEHLPRINGWRRGPQIFATGGDVTVDALLARVSAVMAGADAAMADATAVECMIAASQLLDCLAAAAHGRPWVACAFACAVGCPAAGYAPHMPAVVPAAWDAAVAAISTAIQGVADTREAQRGDMAVDDDASVHSAGDGEDAPAAVEPPLAGGDSAHVQRLPLAARQRIAVANVLLREGGWALTTSGTRLHRRVLPHQAALRSAGRRDRLVRREAGSVPPCDPAAAAAWDAAHAAMLARPVSPATPRDVDGAPLVSPLFRVDAPPLDTPVTTWVAVDSACPTCGGAVHIVLDLDLRAAHVHPVLAEVAAALRGPDDAAAAPPTRLRVPSCPVCFPVHVRPCVLVDGHGRFQLGVNEDEARVTPPWEAAKQAVARRGAGVSVAAALSDPALWETSPVAAEYDPPASRAESFRPRVLDDHPLRVPAKELLGHCEPAVLREPGPVEGTEWSRPGSTLGGFPEWVQDDAWAPCPLCGADAMVAVAQLRVIGDVYVQLCSRPAGGCGHCVSLVYQQ